ncbi:MAG: TPM domain-containing protein [Clostridia bacterium]|nr:TPM domain-containing protein [Clostridia bacterium]
MKRFFAAILLIALLLSACTAEAAISQKPESTMPPGILTQNLRIEDEEDLFTQQEEEGLMEYIRPIATHGCVMIWTTSQQGDLDAKALDYFKTHSKDFNTEDGLLLMFDMEKRQLYLLSRGKMEAYVNRSDAYAITADVSHLATRAEYAACAMEALERVTVLMEEGRLHSPMRMICSLMLGLATGLVVAYLIARRQSMQPMPEPEKRTATNAISCTCELTHKHTFHVSTKRTIFMLLVTGLLRVLEIALRAAISMESDDSSSHSGSRSSGGGSFRSRSSGGGSSKRDSGGSGGSSSF